MNKRINKIIFIMMISIIALTGCQTIQKDKSKFGKKFKHNEPLIKTDVKALGKDSKFLATYGFPELF